MEKPKVKPVKPPVKTPKPKVKAPKPKVKAPKPKVKAPKPKVKPQVKQPKQQNGRLTIKIIQEKDSSDIDKFYDRKINGIINKIKEQNKSCDDKIRFGWNF